MTASLGVASTEKQGVLRVVLLRNGELQECKENAGEWLANAPRGAYTTARTVNRTSVFEFEFHVERLASSVQLMLEAENSAIPKNSNSSNERAPLNLLTSAETLRPLLCKQLTSALKSFGALEKNSSGEVKVTALVTWDSGNLEKEGDLWLHVAELPPRPPHPVKVEVRGAPRDNPMAKDSEWVRQRKALEKDKPKDVNEILLATEEGGVLEGMTSNFFAVVDGAIWTAGDGVLLGTVREVVLEACKEEGIPIVLRAPLLSDAEKWEGAFITSTSRLVLPIDQMAVPTLDKGLVVHTFSNALSYKLEKLVLAKVEANSSRIVID